MAVNLKVSVGGLRCISLGPPLQKLFDLWDLLNIVVSCIVRFIFFIFPRNLLVGSLKRLKTEVGFFILVLTSLYCYYENQSKHGDTRGKGYRSTLRLIYFEAFALMSLSLSTQTEPLQFKLVTSNFLIPFMLLCIVKNNLMVGVRVAVLCYMVMSSRSYSEFRREQRRRGRGEPDDIGLLGKTPHILSPLPIIVHPSPSFFTLSRRRTVNLDSCSLGKASLKLAKTYHEPCTNLEWLMFLEAPSPILIRCISFKTLNFVSLSATEYSTLQNSDWDFTKALRHVRLLNFWLPESRALIPSNALRLLQLIGPDDEYFGDD